MTTSSKVCKNCGSTKASEFDQVCDNCGAAEDSEPDEDRMPGTVSLDEVCEDEEFVETEPFLEFFGLLDNRSMSIGVAGPRGAGKSVLLQRAFFRSCFNEHSYGRNSTSKISKAKRNSGSPRTHLGNSRLRE